MYTAMAVLVAIFRRVLFSSGKRANTRVNRASMLRFSKKNMLPCQGLPLFLWLSLDSDVASLYGSAGLDGSQTERDGGVDVPSRHI